MFMKQEAPNRWMEIKLHHLLPRRYREKNKNPTKGHLPIKKNTHAGGQMVGVAYPLNMARASVGVLKNPEHRPERTNKQREIGEALL